MITTKSVAIVTGASQGIGRATALRLARDFSVIVLAARNKDNLERTAAEVRALGTEAMVFALDLRQPQSAETIVEETLRTLWEDRRAAQHCGRSATNRFIPDDGRAVGRRHGA